MKDIVLKKGLLLNRYDNKGPHIHYLSYFHLQPDTIHMFGQKPEYCFTYALTVDVKVGCLFRLGDKNNRLNKTFDYFGSHIDKFTLNKHVFDMPQTRSQIKDDQYAGYLVPYNLSGHLELVLKNGDDKIELIRTFSNDCNHAPIKIGVFFPEILEGTTKDVFDTTKWDDKECFHFHLLKSYSKSKVFLDYLRK
jgi:hypothetical protein